MEKKGFWLEILMFCLGLSLLIFIYTKTFIDIHNMRSNHTTPVVVTDETISSGSYLLPKAGIDKMLEIDDSYSPDIIYNNYIDKLPMAGASILLDFDYKNISKTKTDMDKLENIYDRNIDILNNIKEETISNFNIEEVELDVPNDDIAIKTNEYVNLRSCPVVHDNTKIGCLSPGTVLDVEGYFNYDNNNWAIASYKDDTVYIASDYIDEVEKQKIINTVYMPTYTPVIYNSNGPLNKAAGVKFGPSGKETYYNLNMSRIVSMMHNMGYGHLNYWVREDGVKMLGDYVMVAADLSIRPRGTILETSLGPGIVCDTGEFIYNNPYQIDIATNW